MNPIAAAPITPSWTQAAPRGGRVLIVDDEEAIRLALARFLRSRGLEVDVTESGSEALERLNGGRYSLIVCDVRMPVMSGLELLPLALRADPALAIIMLSAVNDAATATEALSLGAMDYLVKPIELAQLGDSVERALHRRELLTQQRMVEERIREEADLMAAQLESERSRLQTLTVSFAEALINAMEAKDLFLRGHSQRVAELAASVADAIGLDADGVEAVRLAGRLHDVGKIGIRESVLNKPSSLTPEEFAHVKDHVRVGMEILAPLRHLGVVLEYIQDHHEHVDGGGYPNAKRGAEISIGGKILAATDAFDALTSRRAYREPLTAQQTLEHLRKYVGTLLDPGIYEALCAVVLRRKSLVFLD